MESSAQQATGDQDSTAGELTKQVCCVKYSLMACNAFGIMLGIFVVLFGISYPEEGFPGGYKGKETAGISGFFIIFTLIGYYGAHRQKVYFLVPYSIIIFLFLGGNLVMWGVKPEQSVLDPDSNAVLILAGVYVVLMAFALWLAFQERKKLTQGNVHVTSRSAAMQAPMAAAPGQQPVSLPPHLRPPHQLLPPHPVSAAPGLSPYAYPQQPLRPPPTSLLDKKSWDIDNHVPLNVMYQPASNSYVTRPAAARYGSTSGAPLVMY